MNDVARRTPITPNLLFFFASHAFATSSTSSYTMKQPSRIIWADVESIGAEEQSWSSPEERPRGRETSRTQLNLSIFPDQAHGRGCGFLHEKNDLCAFEDHKVLPAQSRKNNSFRFAVVLNVSVLCSIQ